MKNKIYTTYEGYDIDIEIETETPGVLKEKVKLLKESGFLPKVKSTFGKFNKPQVKETDPCPTCKAPLVKFFSKDGKAYLKCSTSKSSKGADGEWIKEGCQFFQKI